MGKPKMKLSSLFRGRAGGLLTVPLCSNAKTLSLRVGDDMLKTVDILEAETPESWFTNSSETASHSTESEQDLDAESLEMVVKGVVRSERLFFDPGVTSSILEENNQISKVSYLTKQSPLTTIKAQTTKPIVSAAPPIDEISVPVVMESEDPYGDFRRSMEEMVESHGELANDWRSLESMLTWYLRMNGRRSHDVIVSAFVDLLSGLSDSGAGTSPVTDSARYSTAVSSLPSSPLYSLCQRQTEIEEEDRRSC